jgi:hypothetical protein
VTAAILALAAALFAAPPRLSIRELGAQPIGVRPGRYLIGADGASRTVFFFEDRRSTVFRVSAGDGSIREMTLEDAPEFAGDSGAVQQGAFVNERGDCLIPALWRGGSGYFVFTGDGRYVKTIRFNPPLGLRRIARGAGGSLYVLGLEPASRPGPRLLVHKYSAAGARITAFSGCPPESTAAELAGGQVWVKDGLVYHVLPASKRLRVFDARGKLLRDNAIEFPAGASGAIQTAAPAPGGRFLLEWAGAGTYLARRSLSLHDQNGRAISAATPEPERSALLFTDSGGICYLLRYTPDGRQEIVKIVVTTGPAARKN